MNPTSKDVHFAIFLIFLTFLFKLSAVPLHHWSLDLYDNLSTKILIWIMIIPKILLLFLIINLNHLSIINIDYFIIFGILSLIFGSIGLTQQLKIKRFLTFSTITNLGFFLLIIQNYYIYIINIIIYNLTTLNILIILLYLNLLFNREINYISQLQGLYQFNPFLTLTLTINFLSLAGIPPFAGFFTKYLLFDYYINYFSLF
jgi:NADH:ubiquinone oxidoreductase subunit 2 (subunit N)